MPSIAKAIPKASPKRSMKRGQSRPNSKESTVPVTAPTANSTATAFDQFRASRRAASSFRLWPRYSAISIIAGKATPRQAKHDVEPEGEPHLVPGRQQVGGGVREQRDGCGHQPDTVIENSARKLSPGGTNGSSGPPAISASVGAVIGSSATTSSSPGA